MTSGHGKNYPHWELNVKNAKGIHWSPVNFLHKKPVMQSSDVWFVNLNKLLNKKNRQIASDLRRYDAHETPL